MVSIFDHTYSFVARGRLEKVVAQYTKAGFEIDELYLRHIGGKISAFIQLTGTYIEFVEILDHKELLKHGSKLEILNQDKIGPFSIVGAVSNIDFVFESLHEKYEDIAPVECIYVQGDVKGTLGWRMIRVPLSGTPGAEVCCIQYMLREKAWAVEKISRNGVFTVGGYIFYSSSKKKIAKRWFETLNLITPDLNLSESLIRFDDQRLLWISAADYYETFGIELGVGKLADNSICGMLLLTVSLKLSIKYFLSAGFKISRESDISFSTLPDPDTGYAFVVYEESNPERFSRKVNGRLSMVNVCCF